MLTFCTAWGSHYFNRRAPFIIAGAVLAIVGYIILMADTTPGVQYFATFLCTGGVYPATAITLSWPANNVSGQLKRAVACAMQISIGNIGAILGTQLYRYAPRFYLGHGFAVGFLCFLMCMTSLNWYVLARRNREKEAMLGSEKYDPQLDDRESKLLLGDGHPTWMFQL